MAQRSDNPFSIATTALTQPYAALVRTAGTLAWPFVSIVRAYRMRRTADALRALDARTLRDIGIERSRIDMVAQSSVEHPSIDPRVFLDRR